MQVIDNDKIVEVEEKISASRQNLRRWLVGDLGIGVAGFTLMAAVAELWASMAIIGVWSFILLNQWVNILIYRAILRKAMNPLPFKFFLPFDVIDTKAGDPLKRETFIKEIIAWSDGAFIDALARKGERGWYFFFISEEDYALFKLRV